MTPIDGPEWKDPQTPVTTETEGVSWLDLQTPDDYEPCDTCGFDHEYEADFATRWHRDFSDDAHEDDTL